MWNILYSVEVGMWGCHEGAVWNINILYSVEVGMWGCHEGAVWNINILYSVEVGMWGCHEGAVWNILYSGGGDVGCHEGAVWNILYSVEVGMWGVMRVLCGIYCTLWRWGCGGVMFKMPGRRRGGASGRIE